MLIWSRGSQIKVQLIDPKGEELRLSNIVLNVTLYMSGMRRYSFSGGETDFAGISLISFDGIIAEWQDNQRLFLMDYNTPLRDCDDDVGISAPSADELAARVSAAKKWFPEDLEKVSDDIEKSNNHCIESPAQKIKILPEVLMHDMRLVCRLISPGSR